MEQKKIVFSVSDEVEHSRAILFFSSCKHTSIMTQLFSRSIAFRCLMILIRKLVMY